MSLYAPYKNLPETKLGVMANEIWRRDPKMLGIHLARYKFVAKMLAGKQQVAEIGCGDGWYSHIVRQEVENLDLYDLDNSYGPDIRVHDMTAHGAVRTQKHELYDALYCLDVLEHIEKEEAFLMNVVASLHKDGVFIAGMPSLESQGYASPASKAGHINCKSGADLKHLLEQYFHSAFMFGMNDETIHTGFFPMCHYLLAVCAGVK